MYATRLMHVDSVWLARAVVRAAFRQWPDCHMPAGIQTHASAVGLHCGHRCVLAPDRCGHVLRVLAQVGS